MPTHAHTFPCSRAGFDALAGRLARSGGADFILSSPGYPAQTESVIGVEPVAELRFTPSTTPEEIKRFCFGSPGLSLGFVSYTYGMLLRGVASAKPLDFPLGHLKKFRAVAEFDPEAGAVVHTEDPALVRRIGLLLEVGEESTPPVTLPKGDFTASLDRAGYEAGVSEALERIRSGHTYQLNLSAKFSRHWPDLDPLALFMALRRDHPAPFYAWLESGPHRVLSTSPERFLRVADGEVLSQPIKGTLKVEPDAGEYEPGQEERLTGSAKESAELSMIVDLIRNDISTNCDYGSVRVENHKSVFQVDNLLQMYANVRGTLRQDRDCLDLFLDAFPGGSVTGCPKHSSMEIIEALEPHSRGVYCGSAVVIRDERNMDSSIAIRTATWDAASGGFAVYGGSGIVVDSDPAKEYRETIAKLEKFFALGGA
ncbi:chorismate-binding protein [Pseudodesulfovibrio cashew]|uniref:chorismate-binding protein n=1 Tax=Pseudodesulfovibrio cashew TaxID=2678688 RepID=UPI00131D4DEB|nr:anthranilate synthase component I family protein [Pseudodesulfovibrio cashew]